MGRGEIPQTGTSNCHRLRRRFPIVNALLLMLMGLAFGPVVLAGASRPEGQQR